MTARERRNNYQDNIQDGANVLADLYYRYWGEYFHLAVFDDDDPTDIDLSDAQLAHTQKWRQPNLRFRQYDIMQVAGLDEDPFDAAVCLDAAIYLPNKRAALRGIRSKLQDGARLLVVDWCRASAVTRLQEELILEPFYRLWAVPEMLTIDQCRRTFAHADFQLIEVDDLSDRVRPNWERGYQAALQAVAEPIPLRQRVDIAMDVLKNGLQVAQVLKDQFYVALLAKVAADAGILRYASMLARAV